MFILRSFSSPSLGYYPCFNISFFVGSSDFSSLGRHPRFYLYPFCVWLSVYHPRFYLNLVGCLLCFTSLWCHPSFYLGLFLVPLGSTHLDTILDSTYVHCSFIWFPIIVNYLSLLFGFPSLWTIWAYYLVSHHCELSKFIRMFLWFLIIMTPSYEFV